MSPWKRKPLRRQFSCGGRPGCLHRLWIFAWIHGLLWRTRSVETRDKPKHKPDPPEITRADVDEFTRRVGGPKQRRN
jgi:hypothetical protein